MNGLRPVANDEQHAILRILADRRWALGEDHTRMISQLQQLVLELIPGGAKRDLSAPQTKMLLAGVRPRDLVGKTRKPVAPRSSSVTWRGSLPGLPWAVRVRASGADPRVLRGP